MHVSIDAIVQYSNIFEGFVRQIAQSQYLDWEETIYAHRNVAQFLKIPAAMLRYTGTDQVPFDVFSRFESSLDIIQNALSKTPTADPDADESFDEKSDHQTNIDYLFLSACFFIDHLVNPYAELPLKQFSAVQCDRLASFITALNVYEQANYPPTRIQDSWDKYWSETGLPKEPRFTCRPIPTRRSYIRWKVIPAWVKIDTTTPPA